MTEREVLTLIDRYAVVKDEEHAELLRRIGPFGASVAYTGKCDVDHVPILFRGSKCPLCAAAQRFVGLLSRIREEQVIARRYKEVLFQTLEKAAAAGVEVSVTE